MKSTHQSLRRAAIVVATLDTDTADSLLSQLPAEQAARIRSMVMELGDIDPREQDEALVQFCRVATNDDATGVEIGGNLARSIGRPSTLPRRATVKPTNLSPPAEPSVEAPFRFLHETECEQLTPLLASERPQTVALVISHMPPDRAIKQLAQLPAAVQAEVVRRWVDLEEADPDVLREVERGLQSRIELYVRDRRRPVVGVETVAQILAAAQPAIRDQILGNLAAADAELAERLAPPRELEFSDLDQLSDADLARLLRAANPQVAVLALTGARRPLVDRVMKHLPGRDAKLLRRSMERLGPTPLSDVEDAQEELVRLAERMLDQGVIQLGRKRQLSLAG